MIARVQRVLLALALATSCFVAGAAPRKPTVAVMPTQYVSADAVSGANVAMALVDQFQAHDYSVIPMDRSRELFRSRRLSWSRPHAARLVIDFGRRLGADLVAYPRLLSLGVPANRQRGQTAAAGQPVAVLHLRVFNVHTRKLIHSRQVRREFEWTRLAGGGLILSPEAAAATVTEAMGAYFERVAGSKEETLRGR